MLQCQRPNLGMEDREIRRVRLVSRAAQYVGDPLQHRPRPFGDLGGMHAKLFRSLRQRLVALAGRQGHLGLECRPVMASRALHRRAPLVRHSLVASVKQGYH